MRMKGALSLVGCLSILHAGACGSSNAGARRELLVFGLGSSDQKVKDMCWKEREKPAKAVGA